MAMRVMVLLPLVFSIILILGNAQYAIAGLIELEQPCKVSAVGILGDSGDYGTVTPASDSFSLIGNVEIDGEPAYLTGMDFNALGKLYVTVGDPSVDHQIGQLDPATGDPIAGSFVLIVDGAGDDALNIRVNDLAIDRATGTIYGMGDPDSGVAIYKINPNSGVATKLGDMFDMVSDAGISNVVRIFPGGIAFSDGLLTAVPELFRGAQPPMPVNDIWRFDIDVSGDSFDLISDRNVDGPRDDGNIRGLTFCADGTLMYTRDSFSSDVGLINSISGTTSTSSQPDQFLGDIAVPPVLQVGGQMINLNSAALILAGSQMTGAWLIPIIVSGIGFAIVIARKF